MVERYAHVAAEGLLLAASRLDLFLQSQMACFGTATCSLVPVQAD